MTCGADPVSLLPGLQSLVPTLAFALIVPRILAVYKVIAERLTDMEDHPNESSYQNALTTKVFALNSIVAFGGLLLSAYAYIPFGDQIVRPLFSSALISSFSKDHSSRLVLTLLAPLPDVRRR